MANMDDLGRLMAIRGLEDAEGDLAAHWPQSRAPHGDAFALLSEKKFIKIYRLPKQTARDLIETLQPELMVPSRTSALSVESKVLCALKFFGGGSYQTDVGLNFYNGMSQASVSRSISQVTSAINQTLFDTIMLPQTPEELRQVRQGFYEQFQFPGVMGLIDCTHVSIVPPEREVEHMYVNRKLYHSINTQLICDSNLKIMHVCARFPGSSHDSFIWQNSSAYNYMTQLHIRGLTDYFLLGDSGYPLRTWIMTPVENVQPGTAEERYNIAHKGCRCSIERCNGVLKMRWRCLLKDRTLHYTPAKSCEIIKACCVLHNICIANNIPLPEDDPEVDEDQLGLFNNGGDIVGGPRNNHALQAGRQFRLRIIRNRFNV